MFLGDDECFDWTTPKFDLTIELDIELAEVGLSEAEKQQLRGSLGLRRAIVVPEKAPATLLFDEVPEPVDDLGHELDKIVVRSHHPGSSRARSMLSPTTALCWSESNSASLHQTQGASYPQPSTLGNAPIKSKPTTHRASGPNEGGGPSLARPTDARRDAEERLGVLVARMLTVMVRCSIVRVVMTQSANTSPHYRLSRRQVAMASVLIATLLITGLALVSPGTAMWWTFIPAMIIACGLHLASTARQAPAPARVLPIYLVALAWQFLHFAEEFIGTFYVRWPEEIFGAGAMSLDFFIWGNMGSYAAFTIGALALYMGWRIPMLIVWFFAIMGVAGNAIGHLIYALMTGDIWFPGTITALAYWVIGPVLITRLWVSSRHQ